MPLVRLRALVGYGLPVGTPATLTATPRRGPRAAVTVAGDAVIFPQPVVRRWSGTAWDADPELAQLPAGAHWHVVLQGERDKWQVVRNVAAPLAPTDFADLIDVEPGTGEPDAGELAQWAATLALVTTRSTAAAESARKAETSRLNALGYSKDAEAAADRAEPAATRAESAALRAEAAAVESGAGTSYWFDTPTAVWTIPLHGGLLRRPAVTVYLIDGRMTLAEIAYSPLNIVVTFPRPTAGVVVLT